jgi:hypothetical protein
VLAAVILHDDPETLGAGPTVAVEEDRIIGCGSRAENVNDRRGQTLKQSSRASQGHASRAAQIMKLNPANNVDLTESTPCSSAGSVASAM